MKGIAEEIEETYGSISRLKRQKLIVGKCYVKESTRTVFFLVTRKHYDDTPSYDNLQNCLKDLQRQCRKLKVNSLALPKYGAGFDKLDWCQVAEIINKILIKNKTLCTVYLNKSAPNKNDLEENLDVNSKIKKLQRNDNVIREMTKTVKSGKNKSFVLENDVLLKIRKGRNNRIFKQLVVPDILKEDILKLCHDNFTGAHLGEKKTWVKLNNRFYWPNSYSDTINYVKACTVCACMKDPPVNKAPLHPIKDFAVPFDKVRVDILELSKTNARNKYVVVFTDYLTKWVESFPLKNQTAESVARILINEIVTRHSAPKELLSDQGQNFMSRLIKEVCNYFNVDKINTAPYNPKCDGLTEIQKNFV